MRTPARQTVMEILEPVGARVREEAGRFASLAVPRTVRCDPWTAVTPFPVRFNPCHDFVDHNLEVGRGGKVALTQGTSDVPTPR